MVNVSQRYSLSKASTAQVGPASIVSISCLRRAASLFSLTDNFSADRVAISRSTSSGIGVRVARAPGASTEIPATAGLTLGSARLP